MSTISTFRHHRNFRRLLRNNKNGVVFFIEKNDKKSKKNQYIMNVQGNLEPTFIEISMNKKSVRILTKTFTRFIESLFSAVREAFSEEETKQINREILSYFTINERLKLLVKYEHIKL